MREEEKYQHKNKIWHSWRPCKVSDLLLTTGGTGLLCANCGAYC